MDESRKRREQERKERASETGDERVIKRPKSERKTLPDELLEFARSDEKRLRMPPKERSPHLLDPRADAPVRGVSNRDARDVLDAHEAIIQTLLEDRQAEDAEGAEGVEDALAQELAILVATSMYRARNFVDFDAYAIAKLGLEREEALQLADRGAELLGLPPRQPFSELTVAAFFRAEAALREAGVEAIVGLALDEADSSERLLIDLDGAHAARALHAIGGRMTPIALDQEKLRERADERARRWEESRAPAWEEDTLAEEEPTSESPAAEGQARDGFAPPQPKQGRKQAPEHSGERFSDRRGGGGRDRFDDRGGPRGRDRFDDRRGPRGRDRFDDRGGFGGRDRFDDRRGPRGRDRFDDRGGFGGRDRFDDRRGPRGRDRFDDRGGFGGRGRFDDRGGFGGRGRFDDRKGPGGRDRFDDRRGPGGRDRFDDRRGFKGRERSDERRGFGGRDRFDDRRGSSERGRGFGERGRGDDRGGFKKRDGDLYTAKSKRFRKK